MKYRIKVTVSEDNTCRYYPMYKSHWFMPWKSLSRLRKCFGKFYNTEERAKSDIDYVHRIYQNGNIIKSYIIDYKP